MNKLKINRQYTETDLAAAIDQSVEAAVALAISEMDLVGRLLERVHSKSTNKVITLPVDPVRKMCNTDAGP